MGVKASLGVKASTSAKFSSKGCQTRPPFFAGGLWVADVLLLSCSKAVGFGVAFCVRGGQEMCKDTTASGPLANKSPHKGSWKWPRETFVTGGSEPLPTTAQVHRGRASQTPTVRKGTARHVSDLPQAGDTLGPPATRPSREAGALQSRPGGLPLLPARLPEETPAETDNLFAFLAADPLSRLRHVGTAPAAPRGGLQRRRGAPGRVPSLCSPDVPGRGRLATPRPQTPAARPRPLAPLPHAARRRSPAGISPPAGCSSPSMALGGSLRPLLLLWLWPWPAGLAQHQGVVEHEDVLISAPPHLTALVPAAATATVAAGYLPEGSSSLEQNHVAVVTSEGIPVMLVPTPSPTEESTTEASPTPEESPTEESTTEAPTPAHVGIMIVGDTRYQWQEWSPWHCNCAQGSMSRVRDITYSVPGMVLDPAQYDVLRFQRVVCDYKVCHCRPEERQCDRLQVSCDEEEEHICALRDIELDQRQKRKDFWARLHGELQKLMASLKEAFPRARKESKAKFAR
ncbi:protein MENT [Paroedura picta]|uniref:protein MENT n=1 Tax=Paroedura picta TaxID=143630 RepID=UPI0040568943